MLLTLVNNSIECPNPQEKPKTSFILQSSKVSYKKSIYIDVHKRSKFILTLSIFFFTKLHKRESRMKAPRRPIHAVSTWVRRQPPKVKAFLAVVAGMAALVLLRAIVHDHDNLFVAAEAVHAIGISVLIYKLTKEKTCAGNNNPTIVYSKSFPFYLL